MGCGLPVEDRVVQNCGAATDTIQIAPSPVSWREVSWPRRNPLRQFRTDGLAPATSISFHFVGHLCGIRGAPPTKGYRQRCTTKAGDKDVRKTEVGNLL